MRTKEAPPENSVTPAELAARLGPNCDGVLVDVRTPAEYQAGHLPGATLAPLGDLNPREILARQPSERDRLYVICQSGNRARTAIQAFEKAGFGQCVLLAGGMDAWNSAGLPMERENGAGLPIMRQVQIIIGALSFAGALLAILVNPWFALLPLVTGGGLLMAGLSGWCGIALLLAKMPWNRLNPGLKESCCQAGGEAIV